MCKGGLCDSDEEDGLQRKRELTELISHARNEQVRKGRSFRESREVSQGELISMHASNRLARCQSRYWSMRFSASMRISSKGCQIRGCSVIGG